MLCQGGNDFLTMFQMLPPPSQRRTASHGEGKSCYYYYYLFAWGRFLEAQSIKNQCPVVLETVHTYITVMVPIQKMPTDCLDLWSYVDLLQLDRAIKSW